MERGKRERRKENGKAGKWRKRRGIGKEENYLRSLVNRKRK